MTTFTFLTILSILTATWGASIMPNTKVCETPSCVHTASTMLKNMDPKTKPCDNFYQFACGGFEKYTIIPDDKSSISTYGLTRELLQDQLYSVLRQPLPNNTLNAFKKLQQFYFSCLDLMSLEKRDMNPVKYILHDLGEWPVLAKKWDEANFDWLKTTYELRKKGFGVSNIIDISLSTDVKNPNKRVIELDQASLGISVEYFKQGMKHKVVDGYLAYMNDTAIMLGVDKHVAEKDLRESFNFEWKLANISLINAQRRNASALYNPMTVAELQKKYPYMNWLDYFNNLLGPTVTVTESEVVIVNVPSYLQQLGVILNETPKRTVANYMLWRVVSSIVSYLPKQFRDRQLQFSSTSSGKVVRAPRWKECIDKTSARFGLAVGSLYVREFFDEDAKTKTLDMVNNLRAVFLEILEKVDWMDDSTRVKALDKAKAMTNHIAYPDELLDDAKIEAYYKDLETHQEFFEYNLNLIKFSFNLVLKRFRQPVNKTDWVNHGKASVVNAFYAPLENSIQFPAGIFQGMFFAKDRPLYLNYGCIGFTVGHEITHGFDDHGRQFDKNGALVDWWDPTTKEAFKKRAQCIVDQYANFTVIIKDTPKNLNGIATQGENIADNGGMKEAYIAYVKWAEGKEPEARIPGLDYTPRQMFWLSAANKWCSTYKPELLEYLVLNDPHVPGEFRINGPMRNLPEFAKDFNCPLGSPMNPEKKCSVW